MRVVLECEQRKKTKQKRKVKEEKIKIANIPRAIKKMNSRISFWNKKVPSEMSLLSPLFDRYT
jgi:hypothetical protein